MNPKSILNMTLTILLILFFIYFAVWVYKGVRNQSSSTQTSRGYYTVESNFVGYKRSRVLSIHTRTSQIAETAYNSSSYDLTC